MVRTGDNPLTRSLDIGVDNSQNQALPAGRNSWLINSGAALHLSIGAAGGVVQSFDVTYVVSLIAPKGRSKVGNLYCFRARARRCLGYSSGDGDPG